MTAAAMVGSIFKKLCGIFLWISGLFRRLICRVRRGRKNSGTLLPVTTDHIAKVAEIQHSLPSANDVELESWDSWGMDDSQQDPHSFGAAQQTAHHSNNYSHGVANSNSRHTNNHYHHSNTKVEPEPEPEPDYFQDMTPQIKKAAKIVVRKREETSYSTSPTGLSSRLAVNATAAPPMGDELGAWDDSENAWGDEVQEDLSWEAEAAIKEKRRQEREQRHAEQQRRRMEKEAAKATSRREGGTLTAVKLS